VALTLLFISLTAIFIQDLMYRKIHVVLPIAIFIILLFISGKYTGNNLIEIVLFNTVFFIITIVVLTGYMSIKNKKFENPFKAYFGLGDLLFYLAITPLFYLHNYLIFYIISMVFSVLMFFLFKKKLKDSTIPLAGFSSLLLLIIISIQLLFNYPALTLIVY